MKIFQEYKDSPPERIEVSVEEATDKLETRGYWKRGTIKSFIAKGESFQLWTPWANYFFEV